jgi:hypothetical protein
MVSLFGGCPGALTFREAKPEDIECPECGAEVEIWSDELTAGCSRCGARASRELGPSCIDWCSSAEQCIGTEKYQRLRQDTAAEEETS